ncbi:MAG: hypothetical protein ACSNEK_06540 [Parachlamydiaceae bacterium]
MAPLPTQTNNCLLCQQAKDVDQWLNKTSNWVAITNLVIGILNADLVTKNGSNDLMISAAVCVYTGAHLVALKKRDFKTVALMINALCLCNYFQRLDSPLGVMARNCVFIQAVNLTTMLFGDYI